MKVKQCDCCKKCSPEVRFSHTLTKKFNLFEHGMDTDGPWTQKLDICNDCWDAFHEFLEQRGIRI